MFWAPVQVHVNKVNRWGSVTGSASSSNMSEADRRSIELAPKIQVIWWNLTKLIEFSKKQKFSHPVWRGYQTRQDNFVIDYVLCEKYFQKFCGYWQTKHPLVDGDMEQKTTENDADYMSNFDQKLLAFWTNLTFLNSEYIERTLQSKICLL